MRRMWKSLLALLDQTGRLQTAGALLGVLAVVSGFVWAFVKGWVADLDWTAQVLIVGGLSLLLVVYGGRAVHFVRQRSVLRRRFPVVMSASLLNGRLYLPITNQRDTDEFKASLVMASWTRDRIALPLSLLWKDFDGEYRRIMGGGDEAIYVLDYSFVPVPGGPPRFKHTIHASLGPSSISDETDLLERSEGEYETSRRLSILVVGAHTDRIGFDVDLHAKWFSIGPFETEVYVNVNPSPLRSRFPMTLHREMSPRAFGKGATG